MFQCIPTTTPFLEPVKEQQQKIGGKKGHEHSMLTMCIRIKA